MTKIKLLRLKLKSGLLSDLQSDTIFGHFAWRFKEKHGEEELKHMLDLFVDQKPWFTISDGFFEKDGETFFPKPLKITPMIINNKSKLDRINNFIVQKESKEQNLISLNQLNLYLNNQLDKFDESILEHKNKDLPKYKSDLRVSVEIDRNTLTSKKGQLFSDNPKYLDNKMGIAIFVKVLDTENYEKYNCDDIIKNVFEIGFGRKKSSGYGQFEIISLEEFSDFSEPEDANGFISLSHYLPCNNDEITDAYYDINVKYGKLGEDKSKSLNPFKPGMLLMKPGSCFEVKDIKDFYGCAVNKLSDYNTDVMHNGIAFSLNCKL